MQQVYQFHKAIHPTLFQGDFTTNLMQRYLTPLHFWLGMGITYLTQSPVMTAHYMMAIQIGLALLGMFLAVQAASASSTAGLFAATWLLHSRSVIERLTGGLVRGWALPLLCFYIWAAVSKRYRTCLGILLIGCFLHPPAAFLIGVTHGLFLVAECLIERKITRRTLLAMLVAPIVAISAWYVTQMPADIGVMATLESATNTPEMQRPHGRFPFTPLNPVPAEVAMFGFEAFVFRLADGSSLERRAIPLLVLLTTLVLAWHDTKKKIKLVPLPVWCFGIALSIVYLMSRELAFKLYVPDRHLQIPCTVFFIVAFVTAISRLFNSGAIDSDMGQVRARRSRVIALSATALLMISIFVGSGDGLQGRLQFNRSRDQFGAVFAWANKSTPLEAKFAGHPVLLDPMALLGARASYISFETAHPFYDKYLEQARVRLEGSLRAHFATDFAPLLALEAAGNDYFVFDRRRFRNLKSASYGPPFGSLVRDLSSKTPQVFFYFKDRVSTDSELIPFADGFALVVNLNVLKSRFAR